LVLEFSKERFDFAALSLCISERRFLRSFPGTLPSGLMDVHDKLFESSACALHF
jgi:hypothetical protein